MQRQIFNFPVLLFEVIAIFNIYEKATVITFQLFNFHERAARDNEVLGQDGVKRAAAAKKRDGKAKKAPKGFV